VTLFIGPQCINEPGRNYNEIQHSASNKNITISIKIFCSWLVCWDLPVLSTQFRIY